VPVAVFCLPRAPPLLKFWFSQNFKRTEVCQMAAKKEFYIRIKDELVEVTQEVYLTYYRGKRGEETQLEKICRNHVVSYDAFDTESALGAEMLIDTASDEPEDIVIARLMAEKLHDSISKLSEDERQLIYMLFFEDRSERETAKKLGIPLMTLHNKKGAVLAKLLKFLRT
jgi:RNA polymerase sigma factor (sigma-70 family)